LLQFEVETLGIIVTQAQWEALPEKDRLQDIRYPGRYFRQPNADDDLAPSTTAMVRRKLKYRALDIGDRVEAGQMVGMINPVLSLDDVKIKKEKVDAAAADVEATKAMKEESKNRLDTLSFLKSKGEKIVTKEDWGIAQVTLTKYQQEEVSK